MKRAMFLLWFFVATAFAVADEKPHPPLERPKIHAVKVNEPPNIDGLLDDPAWQKAAKVTGFWRMDFDELASEQTEVLYATTMNTCMLLFSVMTHSHN